MNNGEFYLSDAIEAIEDVLASGGEFRMYPKGTSMLPLIVQTRDSVVLVRNFDIPAKKHDIAFYRRKNGQFVLHRVMDVREDGTYTMCGDNQTQLEYGIEKEQIIACVSRLYRKDKEFGTDSGIYSAYVFFWTKMPIRKFFFFIRRVKNKIVRIFRRIFSKRT
ncbi:MAG: hypothetical protein E7677_05700 [Ruminococcaceae bacterium]|nr:hypothetical protein [Oscillospiraceae bacterium]